MSKYPTVRETFEAQAQAAGFELLGESGGKYHARQELPGKFFLHVSRDPNAAGSKALKVTLACPTGERIEKPSKSVRFGPAVCWANVERGRWLKARNLEAHA